MDAGPFIFISGLRWRGRNGQVDHSQSYFKNTYNYSQERYDSLIDLEVDRIGREAEQCVKQTEQAEDTDYFRTEIKVKEQCDLSVEIQSENEQTLNSGQDKFPVGSVVWGKFGKTKWWPGVVIPGQLVKQTSKLGYVWLYWLSDGKLSQVKTSALEPFSKQLLKHLKAPMKTEMKTGIQKALKLLAERSQTDASRFPTIEEWGSDPNGFMLLANQNKELLAPCPESPLPDFVIEDVERLCRGFEPKPVFGRKRKYMEDFSENSKFPEQCLACTKGCTQEHNHPLFEGFLCVSCKDYLKKLLFSVDYDDCTLACVVCGGEGYLAVCDTDNCGRMITSNLDKLLTIKKLYKKGRCFCFDCIEKFTSYPMVKQIEKQEHWNCFLCTDYTVDTHGSLKPRSNRDAELVKFFQDLSLCTDLSYLTNVEKRKIRVLSLFDGIGTGKVVLDQLGLDIEVYYSSEIDTNAIEVLQHNHRDGITEIGDAWMLQKDKLTELCPIDLVLAGPPCDDLSIVNPKRKGFCGSGLLLVKFITILREIEKICSGNTHVFWMMENTGSMLNSFKNDVCNFLGMQPATWDARDFTGQRRRRSFWGNIPGMWSTPDVVKQLEKHKKNLSSVLTPHYNRKARVELTRTITSSCNSLTITNGKNDKLVDIDGVQDELWIEEIERLFGFSTNYTDTGSLSDGQRRRLLGKAWSVPVIKQILSPLTRYFKMKDNE